MTPTTCTRCGAPLPAVPADHRHPEWCAACAARASGAVAPAPALPPSAPTGAGTWGGGPGAVAAPPVPGTFAPMIVKLRLGEALIVGIAAAALGGLAWWASVAFTERQFVYAAIVVGLLVGQGVLIGARKGGVVPGIVAAALTLVALAVAEYFIQRSLAISNFGADVPLWLGFSPAREIVQGSLEDDPVGGLFWLLAAGAAALGAGRAAQRPVI